MMGIREKEQAPLLVAMLAAACCVVAILAPGADGAGWGTSFEVSVPAADDRGTLGGEVAAGTNGDFVYVWLQRDSSEETSIRSRVSRGDGSLGPIRLVTPTNADGEPFDLSISSGDDGVVRVAFVREVQDCTSGCRNAYRAEYLTLDTDGLPSGPAEILDSTVMFDDDFVNQIMIDTTPDGRSLISWRYVEAGGSMLVKASRVPASGSPSAPVTVVEEPEDSIDRTTSAAHGGGGFIAWTARDTDLPFSQQFRMEGRMMATNGDLTAPSNLFPDGESPFRFESSIDGNGKATVMVTRNDGLTSRLYTRQMNFAGTVLGAEPALISDPGSRIVDYSTGNLDSGDDGTVTVTWMQPSAEFDENTRVRTISPDGTLSGQSFQVNDQGTDSNYPAVSSSPAGGAIVMFTEVTGGGLFDSVRARNIGSDGAPEGTGSTLETTQFENDEPITLELAHSVGGDVGGLWETFISLADGENELSGAVYDNTAPVVELWTPEKATSGQAIVVGVESSDRSPVTYSWDIGGTAAAGQFAKHTFAQAGDFTIRVTATDSAGNATTSTAPIEVFPPFVDPPVPPDPPGPPIPPDTKIMKKPKKKVKSKTATFTFTSSLAGSKFECRLDKAGWTDCRSPKTLKKLKPGKHTFRVRAIKGDLLDQTPAAYTWTVKKPKKAAKK